MATGSSLAREALDSRQTDCLGWAREGILSKSKI